MRLWMRNACLSVTRQAIWEEQSCQDGSVASDCHCARVVCCDEVIAVNDTAFRQNRWNSMIQVNKLQSGAPAHIAVDEVGGAFNDIRAASRYVTVEVQNSQCGVLYEHHFSQIATKPAPNIKVQDSADQDGPSLFFLVVESRKEM